MTVTNLHQFLARLAQSVEWINRAVGDKVLRDPVAFREACEVLRYYGRLRRRLLYGSVRPKIGDNIYESDPRKAKRDTARRRKSIGLKP